MELSVDIEVTNRTEPGDLVVWDFRTIHAAYGRTGRRLFSINCREQSGEAAT